MIERGAGRTSGLTDWQLMDVNSMWACLQDHDTDNHWKQVAGWRKVCDLAQTHLSRLQEYRRGLAAAWPPETSAAASVYLAELDELIDKVQRTHDAAAANYTALAAATQAIGTTRAALRRIHEEYATKSQQKQAFESMAADPKAVMGNRVTETPVTDGDLERLNVQARTAMFNLSGELQQAQATLQKPPAVRPPIQAGDPDALGATPTAPIIPPILPIPMPTSDSRTAGRHIAPDTGTPIPRTQGVGPVLGGAVAGLTSNPTNPNAAPAFPPASTGPSSSLAMPPGAPLPSRLTGKSNSSNQFTGDALRRPHTSTPQHSVPRGGVIGSMPSPGGGPVGPNATQPRKINPIGGVIGGGGGAGTGPTGGAGSRPGSGRSPLAPIGGPTPIGGAPTMGGNPSVGHPPGPRRQDQEYNSDAASRWDADNPWETDQGVPPIVQSSDEQGPIDPGPAIGFNR
ncbi:hypothetical protein AB0B86_13815 [Micromonospora sp. NPDC049047]|uniref:hypothetical protein n=1 Tax=Micromonospora sp. NPDC049047 TaxID=3155645 RepID=UPI0033EF4243